MRTLFSTRNSFYILLACLGLALAGCNLPGSGEAGTPTLDVTQAYQTVQARLTEAIQLTPRVTESPRPEATNSPTAQTSPTSQPSPQQTATQAGTNPPDSLCDQAGPGSPIDVTIPDDTEMQPGEEFTKTWRLQNTGTCTWNNQYALVWFSGEQMNAPQSVPLSGEVAPGQSVDLSVDMQAPETPGDYQSNWKLRNPSGVLFGIGPSGGAAFWVRIVVTESTTTTPTVGATLTPTITPTVGIHVSGSATLQPGDGYDLDSNTVNSGGEDLGYQSTEQGLVVTPLLGSSMAVFGGDQPGLSDCQNAALTSDPIAVGDLVGTYLCYRTNQGLPGRLLITAIEADTNLMSVEITTWSIP